MRCRAAVGYSRLTVSRRPEHRALPAAARRQGSVSLFTPLHGRLALQIFAFTAAAAVMLVSVVAPNTPQTAVAEGEADAQAQVLADASQSLDIKGVAVPVVARDNYVAVKPPPPVIAAAASTGKAAPAAGAPDPGTAKAIAFDMVTARGWGQGEYDCLVALWQKESGWNVYAHNKSSGAYGIPQSLPGSKMASAGADWATNPATQITWGLGYIQGRYSTPCGAYSASQVKGWY